MHQSLTCWCFVLASPRRPRALPLPLHPKHVLLKTGVLVRSRPLLIAVFLLLLRRFGIHEQKKSLSLSPLSAHWKIRSSPVTASATLVRAQSASIKPSFDCQTYDIAADTIVNSTSGDSVTFFHQEDDGPPAPPGLAPSSPLRHSILVQSASCQTLG